MTRPPDNAERAAYVALVASLSIVQINLLAAQASFGVAAIAWLLVAFRERRAPVPAFFWPLALFGAATLASAAFSEDPRASLVDCKQLVLFLMVPMVARLARGPRAMTALNSILVVGAIGALIGVAEYALFGFDDLHRRPTGSLSHYMTYSGVIMLALSSAVARLVYYPDQRVWPAIAVPAMCVALAVTFARNAWIGTVAAVTTILGARRLRLLAAVPIVVGLCLLIAPAGIRNRALSIFDPSNPTNRDRVAMLTIGRRIVADHPWFGVGPDQIKVVYAAYRPPDAVNPTNPHLHNVPMNIAAERGLPALAVWLWFIAAAAAPLWRQVREGPAQAIAAAGLAAIVAMLAAGLFEYNFGDSEFLMLFLGLITLPFAARARSIDPEGR
ncbi:MAG: O-antigen ligase family protein [Acidobacteria bacterium]|nr:O-antigen ligase family protein [Acidobacteriota bacterium]